VRIGVERVEDMLNIGLEEIDLGALRMAIEQAVGLADGNRRQRVVADGGDQIDVSLTCAVRTAALAMIDVSYWNGLQIWQ
jgi:hypothetical protein